MLSNIFRSLNVISTSTKSTSTDEGDGNTPMSVTKVEKAGRPKSDRKIDAQQIKQAQSIYQIAVSADGTNAIAVASGSNAPAKRASIRNPEKLADLALLRPEEQKELSMMASLIISERKVTPNHEDARHFSFRSYAEEKEIHFKMQELENAAVDTVENAVFDAYLDELITQCMPEFSERYLAAQDSKTRVLSKRLAMTVVVETEELLANRNISFLDTRTGPDTETAPHAPPTPSPRVILPPQSNGEEVMQKVMCLGTPKNNPLLSARSRRSVAKPTAFIVDVTDTIPTNDNT